MAWPGFGASRLWHIKVVAPNPRSGKSSGTARRMQRPPMGAKHQLVLITDPLITGYFHFVAVQFSHWIAAPSYPSPAVLSISKDDHGAACWKIVLSVANAG
jgi:hypothetical protein